MQGAQCTRSLSARGALGGRDKRSLPRVLASIQDPSGGLEPKA